VRKEGRKQISLSGRNIGEAFCAYIRVVLIGGI
jgi:hypothetical protein